METTENEIRSVIQEWMAEALDIEHLAKIYAIITSESDKQLSYMSEEIKNRIKETYT